MKLNNQKKIEDMLKESHSDLSFIAASMINSAPLSDKIFINMHLFKALNSEILMWLNNIDNGSILTLASRNIFELYLILLEVNKNEYSMKRFFAQLGSDRDELNSAFMNKCESVGYELSNNDKQVVQEDLDKSPFENIETHSFRIHHLAKTHRYQKDYDFFYKLSSKLIHPSAYRVFGVDDFSTQYEVVSMVGYHFICKATDFAVDFYNNNVVTSTPYV